MSNALLGYTNRVLDAVLSASSADAALPVGNLATDQGAPSSAWQTAAGITDAYVTLDAGSEVSWRAFCLSRTNLTGSARVRWRVGSARALNEQAAAYGFDATLPSPALPAGATWARASDNATGKSTYWNASGALAVAASGAVRLQHDPVTLEQLGFLSEPARTNLVRNPRLEGSVVGNPGTVATNMAHSANGGLSAQVVGSGTEDGVPYVDIRVTGTNAALANITVWFETTTGIAAATGDPISYSVFAKLQALAAGSGPSNFNLLLAELTSVGGVVVQTASAQALPTDARLATQRFSYNYVLAGGATVANVRPVATVFFAAGTQDATIRFGCPQVENGLFPTMPILPNAGAPAATARGADSMTIALSGWDTSLGMTIYAEQLPIAQSPQSLTEAGTIQIDAGGATNRMALRTVSQTNGQYYVDVIGVNGGTTVIDSSNRVMTMGQSHRVAAAWGPNDFAVYDSIGSAFSYDTACPALSSVTRILVSNTNTGRQIILRRARWWNARLSDGQLRGLVWNDSTLDLDETVYDSGDSVPGIVKGVGQAVHVAPSEVVGRYARCDIYDAGNPDGFLNVPLMYAGPAWQPSINMSFQSTFHYDVQNNDFVTRGGQEFPTFLWERRRWEIVLGAVKSSEVWSSMMEAARVGRQNRNVLFVPDPDSSQRHAESVFGRLEPNSDVTYPVNSLLFRSWRARVTERL